MGLDLFIFSGFEEHPSTCTVQPHAVELITMMTDR
jgi:hypothetical protein